MKDWKRPECYVGATWYGWKVFLGRNRDSSILENTNFECALAQLKPLALDVATEDDISGVQVVRENHWAVGWVEWIAIHSSQAEAIRKAEEIETRMEDYPVLDENAFSDAEHSAYCSAWSDYGANEFRRELERAELVEEDALDGVDPDTLMQSFELLVPSGEYHFDGAPNIRIAIENAKRNGLSDEFCRLCGLETEVAS